MKKNAIFLIDLENFYLSREKQFAKESNGDVYAPVAELEALTTFANEMAGDRRIIVRRAYADFNVRRAAPRGSDRPWDYYLQPMSRHLMELGIEPVQVFRFPGGGNKNAADMRLAMDATALATGRSAIEQCILVSGDADFIPVILELKRQGVETAVIGVQGSTKAVVEKYSDRFEYFEGLVAVRESEEEATTTVAFEPVKEAINTLLHERGGQIKFAAVKPLLGQRLQQPFDPNRFNCDNTGSFLKEYASQLGIVVRKDEYDWVIELPSDQAASLTTSKTAQDIPTAVDKQPAPEHTTAVYKRLLSRCPPRIYPVPPDDWNTITEFVLSMSRSEDGKPKRVYYRDLLNELVETCADNGVEDASKKVEKVVYQIFKAGSFRCVDEGPELGKSSFLWSRAAELNAENPDLASIRRRVRSMIVRVLAGRLRFAGLDAPVDANVLGEMFSGGETAPEELAELQRLIDEQPAGPVPAPDAAKPDELTEQNSAARDWPLTKPDRDD